GHGRYHYLEQIKFMLQSRGSLEELIDDLNVCSDEEYLPNTEIPGLKGQGWRVYQLTNGYIRYLRERKAGAILALHESSPAYGLACRWNCKAGKCGSCSAEVNGMPRLMCMNRLSEIPLDKPITVEPMKTFPIVRDLATDVSWNFRVKKKIRPFKPRAPDAPDGTWRMEQEDIDRVQEFRKCIECYLCQDVCHVLRDHQMHEKFIGPRFLIHVAALEMHPLDTEDRLEELRNTQGIGYCNITKC